MRRVIGTVFKLYLFFFSFFSPKLNYLSIIGKPLDN